MEDGFGVTIKNDGTAIITISVTNNAANNDYFDGNPTISLDQNASVRLIYGVTTFTLFTDQE